VVSKGVDQVVLVHGGPPVDADFGRPVPQIVDRPVFVGAGLAALLLRVATFCLRVRDPSGFSLLAPSSRSFS
jgi:hypothetical protein